MAWGVFSALGFRNSDCVIHRFVANVLPTILYMVIRRHAKDGATKGKESMSQIIAIANDHAGVMLKHALIPVVRAAGFGVLNLGTDGSASVDYPDYGKLVGETVASGKATYGIAICGSGIGISMAANRIAGARCALCYSPEVAALARQHNDANILALGARLIGEADAKRILETFLTTAFEGGRHAARVQKLA